MDKFTEFIGIDISKEYFDVVLLLPEAVQLHHQFPNDQKGVRSFVKWIQSSCVQKEVLLICMEHTGMYGQLLTLELLSRGYFLWIEMSYRIIRSIGLQRGKSDLVDAGRIAHYAQKYQDVAICYELPSQALQEIRTLLMQREKLVVFKASLKRHEKELSGFDSKLATVVGKHQRSSLRSIEKDIAKIELTLDKLIALNNDIQITYERVTSIPGIGKMTALFMICFTDNFSRLNTPRQLACYCGVVPFEYSSGKSIRLKPRVHYLANKKLKKQLHMCAISSLTCNTEIKRYYQRKVTEGKHKMLVINNIRNKLVHTICACIREQRLYKKTEIA